jgi:hypothetical protein
LKKIALISVALLSMMALMAPIVFAPTPIVQQVTGGGWILAKATCQGKEISKKTFGFNAEELEDGTLRGNVEYVDHGAFDGYDKGFPHVHGYDITALTIVGNEARIKGICRLNGDNTPRIFYVNVTDVDEPGKYDWFSIYIPSIPYYAGAELGFPEDRGGGGNIQVHRPAP